MKYQVDWEPAAFRNLVKVWVASGEPESAIRAFDAIEATLSRDAELQGESRSDGRRILIVSPIGVIYRAKPEVGEVLILDAWLVKIRK